MPKKIYHVKLTPKERQTLMCIINKGKHPSRRVKRANILLLSDSGRKDQEIIQGLGSSPSTVARIRERFTRGGLEEALNEKPRSGQPPKVDGRAKAMLTAIACSKAPQGHERWTCQMIADRLVELKVVDSISDEAVRLILKKMNLSPGRRNNGA